MRKFYLFMAVIVIFLGLYGCEKLGQTEKMKIQEQNKMVEEMATTSKGDLIIWDNNQISVVTYSDNISISFYQALGLGYSDGVPTKSVARRIKKIVRKTDEHYREWAAKFLLQ